MEKLKADQLVARKARDGNKVTFLSFVIGEASNVGKMSMPPRETADSEVIAVVKKLIDKVTETRSVLVTRNLDTSDADNDLAILSVYLPKQMTAEELEDIINEYKSNAEFFSIKTIMAHLKENYAGTYDSKMAANIVNSILKG